MKSRVCVAFLFLAGSLAAQFDAATTVRNVRVHVTFENGICDLSTQVRLMGHSGPVEEAVPNDRCEVDFVNVPAGTYHLNISGREFTDTDNVITTSTLSSDFEVKVKRASDAGSTGMSPFVSAANLAIPARAQKEFDKSNQSIDRQDFTKAIQRLNTAIAIYPAYASAYNNLGVVYARLGDRVRESEALQKAISIDDHFAPAYFNLGRMSVATGDFPNAESALTKAASFDPSNGLALVLLAYSEFMNRKFDQAITDSRKAHALPGPHAFAHQVAARAYAQKHDAANAIIELEQFLKEEPQGERADVARKDLAALRAIPQRTLSADSGEKRNPQ